MSESFENLRFILLKNCNGDASLYVTPTDSERGSLSPNLILKLGQMLGTQLPVREASAFPKDGGTFRAAEFFVEHGSVARLTPEIVAKALGIHAETIEKTLVDPSRNDGAGCDVAKHGLPASLAKAPSARTRG